jgi:Ca-activated chloride channel family protein
MVRPTLVLAVVLAAGSGGAHASSGSRVMGMYPTSGGSVTAAAPLPMLESKVEVTVRGPIVETIVTQRFHNRSDRATEATYIFPLPVDAAVSAMWITSGSRTIRAAIEKRADAQRRYEAAVRSGVAAAVLDQERPDVFTQTVSAIPAKGLIEITLRYDSVARHADGSWELVLPMVVAPRYVPGAVSGRPTTGTGRAPDTDRAPDASRVTPPAAPNAGGATTVAVTFVDPVIDVASPTHELAGKGAAFSFTDPHSDHDAVLRWRSIATAEGWIEAAVDGGYAAVVVAAPAAAPRKGPIRVVLVLDRAATIKGDATVVAQPFVRALIGALGGTDKVAVIGSDRFGWRSPAETLRAIEQTWTRPGTPFDLTRVLERAKPDGAALVLVTDGLVADDRAAIAAAKRLGVPVHVIGVGPAPARGLLTQIAAVTGGTIRFTLPADDLAAAAKSTLADIANPPAPLTVSWGTLAASDVVPGVLPRLGAGQAMIVLARVKRVVTANARAHGELFSLEATAPSRKLDGATTVAGPLARRWARARLDDLLVGAENQQAVTRHALAFGLVSPYTSLVAIGTDVIVEGGVKHSVAVPVSVPSGMSWVDVKREIAVDAPTGGEVSTKTTKQELDKADKFSGMKKKALESTQSGAGSDDDEDSDAESEEAPMGDATKAPSAGVATAEPMDYTEDEISVSRSMRRRALRISASLGGGVAAQADETSGLISLGARVELGRRTLFGADASLWLVDGLNVQGRTLVTIARRGIGRWFELGAGVGAHFGGTGLGPAGSLSLRLRLPPVPAVAGYLRYDGALLIQDDSTRQRQNTLTIGIERSF